MRKLTQNANFSIFHDLQSDLKVSEIVWEVKKILRGQSKHGPWGSNVKTRKFFTTGAVRIEFVAIFCTIFGTMPPLQPPSGGFELFS